MNNELSSNGLTGNGLKSDDLKSSELNCDKVVVNKIYQERVDYISNIPRFTRKAKLENTRMLLEELGNPHRKYKSIHVAGTNGKGSVSKMMAGILERLGFSTGLFISPHLVRINERISINSVQISDIEFLDIDRRVMDAVDKLLNTNEDFEHPAFFEYIFAMGALYFAEKGCEYVVFETGLGGRLDATNILSPELCIITSIGLDHMQYLGNTIKEIAGEKAGIIMPKVPVVYNTGEAEADEVIRETAKRLSSEEVNVEAAWPEYMINETDNESDINESDNESDINETDNESDIKESENDSNKNDLIAELPAYQQENAKTAYTAYRVLSDNLRIHFDEKVFYDTIKSFRFAGRLEYIADNIILDGAHNEDAVRALIRSLDIICKRDGWKKISLFFAVSSDKDYNSIIKLLSEGLDIEDVYVSELHSDRREDAGTVMKLFQKYLPAEKSADVVGSTDMKKLWETATGELTDDTLLVAVGSLYMVGEIKGFL